MLIDFFLYPIRFIGYVWFTDCSRDWLLLLTVDKTDKKEEKQQLDSFVSHIEKQSTVTKWTGQKRIGTWQSIDCCFCCKFCVFAEKTSRWKTVVLAVLIPMIQLDSYYFTQSKTWLGWNDHVYPRVFWCQHNSLKKLSEIKRKWSCLLFQDNIRNLYH